MILMKIKEQIPIIMVLLWFRVFVRFALVLICFSPKIPTFPNNSYQSVVCRPGLSSKR